MEENKQIAKYSPAVEALAIQDLQNYGEIFYQSGYFKDITKSSQAIVKILAGKEVGLTPFQSMNEIFIVEGKTFIGASIIANKIRSSGKYDYKILSSTSDECELEFIQLPDKSLGKFKFTIEDARRAGLTGKNNWKNWPRDMLFKRAISGGQRMHCPDIYNLPVYEESERYDKIQESEYTIEESEPSKIVETKNLIHAAMKDSKINNGGNGTAKISEKQYEEIGSALYGNPENKDEIIAPTKEEEPTYESFVNQESNETPPLTDRWEKPTQAAPQNNGEKSTETKRASKTNAEPPSPYVYNKSIGNIKDYFQRQTAKRKTIAGYIITPNTLKDVNIAFRTLCIGDETKRKQLIEFFTGKDSSKKLTEAEGIVLLFWMGYVDYNSEWTPSSGSIEESELIFATYPEKVEVDNSLYDDLMG